MKQFVYLMSSHSDAQHREGVRVADVVRTSEPRTLNYRAENPSCKILKYVNVAHTINNISPAMARVNGWICVNDAGQEVHHVDTPTEFALDLHQPACRQAVVDYCKLQKEAGYDGIFGDYLGKPFSYNKYHYGTDNQLNHADGTPYTDSEMAQDMLSLVQTMKALDCGILLGNAIPKATGSYSYYAGNYKTLSNPITAELDYIMIEGALGWDEAEALTRSVTDWEKCVQMWKELPAKIIMYCKPIGNNEPRANFALGSYMKTARTDTLYHYSSVSSYQFSAYWQSLMALNFGDYVGEGPDWVEYDNATFRIDNVNKMGSIEFKEDGGDTWVVRIYNDGDTEEVVIKRRVVVTETPVTIPANGYADVELSENEALVLNRQT